MNWLKRNCPYVIGLLLSVFCTVFAFIPIFWIGGTSFGYNLYINLSLSSLGFWHILLCIFETLFFFNVIAIFVISLLEVLKDTKILEFKITLGKITSLLVLKFCFVLLLIISAVMTLLLWFMILANGDIGLVFGAGMFIILFVILLCTIIFMFLDRGDYFKNWEQIKDTKQETTAQKQDVIKEEENSDKNEEEIVIEPEKNDK